MNRRTVLTIVRKELLETLRDRRTLIAMIGIPVLLYPALFVIITQVVTLQQAKMEKDVSRVALALTTPIEIKAWLDDQDKIKLTTAPDPAQAVRDGEADAGITAQADLVDKLTSGESAEITIHYDGTEQESRHAVERVRDVLDEQFDRLLNERLSEAKLDASYIKPLAIETGNVASAEKRTGSFLAGLLPMLLVVMVGVGAFYPAVDLTAGEKERGTFETLLSTPTSKLEIVTGKFITVFCLAMLTGLLNLGSMTGSLAFQLIQLPDTGGESLVSLDHVSFVDFALILVALMPLAFFICGLMMAIAIFARDFKEAQNFVTPFYMMILVPGIIASMPGVELSAATQLIPIANVTLLFKAILTGDASAEAYITVFVCTSVYALAALLFAGWLFQSEQVILNEDKGFPLSLRRDEIPPRDRPTASLSLGIFAMVMLLLYYPASYAQGKDLIIGSFITQWLLLAAPIVALLWYLRIDLRTALRWHWPGMGALMGGILLALGGFLLVTQLGIWQRAFLPESESLQRIMEELFAPGGEMRNVWLLMAAVAVSPAICEEIVFRGAILSGIRAKLPFWTSVILVGLLFGLFHLSVYRMLPTALLGMVITWAVLRSGSIFTGMLMHFINNGLGVLIATDNVPTQVTTWFTNIETQGSNLPWQILAGALVTAALGITIIQCFSGDTKETTTGADQT